MRLGTAFATTVAVAVAPRGVSADGNSVSSKLQVHVSCPAHVVGTGKCKRHMADMMGRTAHCCCMRSSSDSIMEMDWRLLGITSPTFAQTRGFCMTYK